MDPSFLHAERPLPQLRSLPLLCLTGVISLTLVISPASPAKVFQHIFHALAGGCSYFAGVQGAFGRLHAWQSLGAILNLHTSSVPDLERYANTVEWYLFSVQSDWFYSGPSFNLGIVALDRSACLLTVFALSDVD
ncbi:DUF6183 family protein [Gemmata sp.]|uniref:DUF6183 family protein n=1 Tax=Gemmata sp. TaxID=1914242 RepID=UPI003F70D2A7